VSRVPACGCDRRASGAAAVFLAQAIQAIRQISKPAIRIVNAFSSRRHNYLVRAGVGDRLAVVPSRPVVSKSRRRGGLILPGLMRLRRRRRTAYNPALFAITGSHRGGASPFARKCPNDLPRAIFVPVSLLADLLIAPGAAAVGPPKTLRELIALARRARSNSPAVPGLGTLQPRLRIFPPALRHQHRARFHTKAARRTGSNCSPDRTTWAFHQPTCRQTARV